MKTHGEIPASLILAYNYDSLILVQAAAEETGSTDPAELAEALESADVLEAAPTAIIGTYHFSEEAHSAQPSEEEFVFIAPGILKDGQFQP